MIPWDEETDEMNRSRIKFLMLVQLQLQSSAAFARWLEELASRSFLEGFPEETPDLQLARSHIRLTANFKSALLRRI